MSHHAQPQPEQPYAAQPAPQVIYTRPLPMSSNAVISLVAGIVGAAIAPCAWIVPVLGVLAPLTAVIAGHQALKGIRAAPDTMRGQGLATAGLWLGYLVGVPMLLWNIGYAVSIFTSAWNR